MHDTAHLDRLYVVVRADLPAGLQAAQAVHAAFEFANANPLLINSWISESNFLVVVAVRDEFELADYARAARERGILLHVVTEPDLGDEATALVLAPGEAAKRLCSSLPLALRETVPSG